MEGEQIAELRRRTSNIEKFLFYSIFAFILIISSIKLLTFTKNLGEVWQILFVIISLGLAGIGGLSLGVAIIYLLRVWAIAIMILVDMIVRLVPKIKNKLPIIKKRIKIILLIVYIIGSLLVGIKFYEPSSIIYWEAVLTSLAVLVGLIWQSKK